MVKVDPEAVARLLNRGRYVDGMGSFTLESISYEFLEPAFEGAPEDVHSWEYGKWPKVRAAIPLVDGGTVQVYGEASRWNQHQIIVSWQDDDRHPHWAWIPAANVERVTDSDWDVEEYRKWPPDMRGIRWGNRFQDSCPLRHDRLVTSWARPRKCFCSCRNGVFCRTCHTLSQQIRCLRRVVYLIGGLSWTLEVCCGLAPLAAFFFLWLDASTPRPYCGKRGLRPSPGNRAVKSLSGRTSPFLCLSSDF